MGSDSGGFRKNATRLFVVVAEYLFALDNLFFSFCSTFLHFHGSFGPVGAKGAGGCCDNEIGVEATQSGNARTTSTLAPCTTPP